ncbi:hypothetical protein V5739_04300 [Salinimicrobium sp. TIG7-5_MAKvit]
MSIPSNLQAQLIEPNSEAVETSCDVILLALPATAALTTVVMKDRKGFWQFTKGFATNLAVTAGLKYAINKRRPFNSGGRPFPRGIRQLLFRRPPLFTRGMVLNTVFPGMCWQVGQLTAASMLQGMTAMIYLPGRW